jgi:hypothetical protein
MTYSAYSFVALSRARHGKAVLPQKEKDPAPSSDALKLTGSARIRGFGSMAPWYVRAFQRMLGRSTAPGIKFELVLNVGVSDMRSQLGILAEVKSAVIEIAVVPDAE